MAKDNDNDREGGRKRNCVEFPTCMLSFPLYSITSSNVTEAHGSSKTTNSSSSTVLDVLANNCAFQATSAKKFSLRLPLAEAFTLNYQDEDGFSVLCTEMADVWWSVWERVDSDSKPNTDNLRGPSPMHASRCHNILDIQNVYPVSKCTWNRQPVTGFSWVLVPQIILVWCRLEVGPFKLTLSQFGSLVVSSEVTSRGSRRVTGDMDEVNDSWVQWNLFLTCRGPLHSRRADRKESRLQTELFKSWWILKSER